MDVFQLVNDTLVDPANRTAILYTITAAFFYSLRSSRSQVAGKNISAENRILP